MKKIMTLDQLHTIANEVLAKARTTKSESATVIALHGDLGSGKTTLTQEIAKLLEVKESVISPTFVIMKSYKIKDETWKNLVHIDAYRLEKSTELHNLGWQELMADKNNLIIMEWPEQVPECIPEHTCHIYLIHVNEEERAIEF